MRSAPARSRNTLIVLGYALAGLSCVLGLFFCLMKSPQARADSYRALAVESFAASDLSGAEYAVRESLRLDPRSLQNWQLYAFLLQHKGDQRQAAQARAIVARLQGKDLDEPVYAMPADFRLSLLTGQDLSTP